MHDQSIGIFRYVENRRRHCIVGTRLDFARVLLADRMDDEAMPVLKDAVHSLTDRADAGDSDSHHLSRDSPDGFSQSPTMVAQWASDREFLPELSR